jgi:hypothetical protein
MAVFSSVDTNMVGGGGGVTSLVGAWHTVCMRPKATMGYGSLLCGDIRRESGGRQETSGRGLEEGQLLSTPLSARYWGSR